MDFKRGVQLGLLNAWLVPRSFPANDGRGVSGSAVKSVLRAIDDHVRKEAVRTREPDLQTADIPLEKLELATGHSNRVVRRAVFVLVNQLSLVIGDKVHRDNSPCWNLGVAWPLLCEAVDQQRNGTEDHAATAHKANGHGAPSTRPPGTKHAATVAASPICAGYATTLSPKPLGVDNAFAGEGGEVLDELIGRVARAGVWSAATMVPAAVERCGAAHVDELVSHYERNHQAAGWDAQRLAGRLKNAHPAVPPSEGWGAGAKPQGLQAEAAKANERERLEAEWGFELDCMPEADRRELARSCLTGANRDLFRMSPEDGHQEPPIRLVLLRNLAERNRCET